VLSSELEIRGRYEALAGPFYSARGRSWRMAELGSPARHLPDLGATSGIGRARHSAWRRLARSWSCSQREPHRLALDDAASRRLWDESAKLVGLAA
jgi:hypothetical protein